eukprot:CAMPEP_0119313258 /NCGR_PEP_ID=MMETSP1333-20130426/28516_1 /TAXON_ID=418940 /ORGANISM="Scyphosphaera apsteinii, Strain RCC1455" /LENGTH=124 /DNA_ID=CAMNT_0007318059 /DNA_START=53 /DNA_END=423 /DNA_ORIENTATION=-
MSARLLAFLLLLGSSLMSLSQAAPAEREYYDLLGVAPDCSQADLKRAWRRVSLQNHPDRGGDAEQFKRLNEAYQVLSDPEKRAAYDRWGKAGADGNGDQSGFGGMGGFPGFGGMGGFPGFGGMG